MRRQALRALLLQRKVVRWSIGTTRTILLEGDEGEADEARMVDGKERPGSPGYFLVVLASTGAIRAVESDSRRVSVPAVRRGLVG